MTWPFENDTGATVKKLAKRSLQAGKNTIAILSIVLAAVMFTSVFTIALCMKDTWEESTMRGIGTYAHAGLKHVTLDEYEELASDSRWADHGYCISVGFAVGNAFLKTPGEVRWADDFYAESSFCYPDSGHMPETEKEIAMSRLLLTALGLSHELGTEVELTIQTHTQTITNTFTLCGTWEGDAAAGAQEIWLSRVYTDKVAPVVRGSSKGVDDSNDTGYVAGSFMLPSAWNLKARAEEIAADHGMEGTGEYVRDWYSVGLYGLDEFPASKLEVLEGELDMEKWRSGEGVFVSPAVAWGNASWYHPGDMLTVVYENAVDYDADSMDFQGDGTEKTYEVLAVVEYPQAFSCGHQLDSGTCFFFPTKEYLAHVGDGSLLPMMTIFDMDDDHLAAAEQWIQDYTENIDPTLGYRSRGTLAGTYQGLINMFTIVGGALCALLALIGVLNFINSMVTSVLTRRGEIAMLQSVGMTGKQVQKMLVFEGLGYAVLGIVSSLILAALVNVAALRSITTGMDYFTYRFTLTPALLCAIPLLAVTALVPWLCYRKMARASIVERLRLTE